MIRYRWMKAGVASKVPRGARLRKTTISENPVQPLRYFVSLTVKSTSSNYNFRESCVTLTVLCEPDREKHIVKLQFLNILCNPCSTL